MAGMKLSQLEFIQLLPSFMRDDASIIALGKATDNLLGTPGKRLNTIRTWDMIDALTEVECDELAWEMDTAWYDYSCSLEVKRELIKNSLSVKRIAGTRAAVDTVLHAIFQEDFELEEWWQYNGKPYTFRINVDVSERGLKAEEHKAAVRSITLTKNLRSHLEGMNYQADYTPGALYAGAWSGIVNRVEIWPELACSIETRAAARIGGPGAAGKQRLEIWPETVSSIEASTGVQIPAKLTGRQRVEIY